MSETSTQKKRNKLAKIYGVGILAFSAIVGFITVLAKFLAHLDMT
jgi:hypothetical protein